MERPEKEVNLQYDEVENFNNFEHQTTSRANA
jgi:hypothetical protein